MMMAASIAAVELVGPQLALLHRPPVFRRRLCRQLCSSSRRVPGPGRIVGRLAHAPRAPVGRRLHSDALAFGPTDAHFLAGLLKKHPEVAPFGDSQPPGSQDGQMQAAAVHQSMPDPVAVEQPAENLPGTEKAQQLPRIMQNALLAIRQKDSRRLLIWLKKLAMSSEEDLRDSVALLPQTTFSEFLRALDPMDIGPDVDPTHGTRISVGMWKFLNMQTVIDEYGTRRVMLQLLESLIMLSTAFQDQGRVMTTEDHIHLIRAAGAVGDVEGARLLWKQLNTYAAHVEWKKGDAYSEFVKARYQVSPISYGYDRARVSTLKPRDLHRHAYVRLDKSVKKLDRLRLHLRKSYAFFGLDRRILHAEDHSRRLRKRMSVTRFFWYTIRRGHLITEETLCSFIVAFGRANALHFLKEHILADYFGFRIWNDDKTGQCEVVPIKPRRKRYKNLLRPEAPRLKPTELLLYAVVEAYCCNGRLNMALRLIDYINRVFGVKVPDKVWFDLLGWAQTLRSKPVRTAWKTAGWQAIIPEPFTVSKVWQTMTSPPFLVQPGFDEYVTLVRHLISRGGHGNETIVEAMEKLRRCYDEQCAVYERAVFAYTRVLRDGVDASAAFSDYQKARFRKSSMWFTLSETCHQYLQNYRPSIAQSLAHVQPRHLPRFIDEFRHFLPATINYRILGGYVSLRDMAKDEAPATTREFPIQVPMPHMKPDMQLINSRQRFRHNRHSLANFKNTRLDPLPLLLTPASAFRRTS